MPPRGMRTRTAALEVREIQWEAACWILSPVFSTSWPNPRAVLHELENPATRSIAAPTVIAKKRMGDFVFRQLELAMRIGFMVGPILQVSRQFSEKLQAIYF